MEIIVNLRRKNAQVSAWEKTRAEVSQVKNGIFIEPNVQTQKVEAAVSAYLLRMELVTTHRADARILADYS